VFANLVNSMKKILSERNLVVVLFIAALVIFSFAQEDAEKAEKLNRDAAILPSLLVSPKQSAVVAPAGETVITPKQQRQ